MEMYHKHESNVMLFLDLLLQGACCAQNHVHIRDSVFLCRGCVPVIAHADRWVPANC